MACDAGDPDQVAAFIAATLAHFGAIDILVNNAGQLFFGPAVELEERTVEAALRNTFWLQYRPTMAVLPHMRARGAGRRGPAPTLPSSCLAAAPPTCGRGTGVAGQSPGKGVRGATRCIRTRLRRPAV